jgi:hypothetical protein
MVVVLTDSTVLFWTQRPRLTLAEFSCSLQLGRTAEPLMLHVPACTSKAFSSKDLRLFSATIAPKAESQAGRVAGSRKTCPSVRARRPEDVHILENRFMMMPPPLTKAFDLLHEHVHADVNGRTATRPE